MDLLAAAAEWLHGQRVEYLTTTVGYRRQGSATVLNLDATIGRTDAKLLRASEMTTSAGIRDYLFATSDFVSGSDLVPPAKRDQIIEPDGTTYEVAELPGEPAWRFSDEHRNAIRVHAVRA